jgi:hypothetical protein
LEPIFPYVTFEQQRLNGPYFHAFWSLGMSLKTISNVKNTFPSSAHAVVGFFV